MTYNNNYRWINQGGHWLPKREPQVKKSCFHTDTPKGPSSTFMKHAYQMVASSNTIAVLIDYTVDGMEVVVLMCSKKKTSEIFILHVSRFVHNTKYYNSACMIIQSS